MIKEDLKDVAIRCKTFEEAKKVCNLAGKLGLVDHSHSFINNWELDIVEGWEYYDIYNDNVLKKASIDRKTIHSAQWSLDNFTPSTKYSEPIKEDSKTSDSVHHPNHYLIFSFL